MSFGGFSERIEVVTSLEHRDDSSIAVAIGAFLQHRCHLAVCTAREQRAREWIVAVTVETGGAGTLNRSLAATRGGGLIGMLGALTGLQGDVNVALILMKRLRVAGIFVDSRAAFAAMNTFIADHDIRPVIDRTFSFDEFRDALRYMAAGRHFGKIVVTV